MDIAQRIAEIEKEIRETPYHKGTEHHIGLLRARAAKLQDQLVEQQSKKGGGGGPGFAIKKAGDATVVLVGPPSAGKSTLLNALTNANSTVAPYTFTTVSVVPGMMNYRDALIQILDVPGLISGASQGRGRGREVISVVRGADLLVFVTEVGKENKFKEMEEELYGAGIRINTSPPQVRIEKKSGGGVVIRTLTRQDLAIGVIKEIAHEFNFKNTEISIREKLSFEKLIDAFSKNRVYVRAVYVINKSDLFGSTPGVERILHPRGVILPISAKTGKGLEELKKLIWDNLEFVRVYLTRDGKTDHEPMIIRRGDDLLEVAQRVGSEFAKRVRSVKISGPGSKFQGQAVPLTHPVSDGMVVTFAAR